MDAALTAPHGPIWYGASVPVVDDEPSVREILRRTLEQENFHVEEAPDGESALRLIQERSDPFDLVLTDGVVPGDKPYGAKPVFEGLGVLFNPKFHDVRPVPHRAQVRVHSANHLLTPVPQLPAYGVEAHRRPAVGAAKAGRLPRPPRPL